MFLLGKRITLAILLLLFNACANNKPLKEDDENYSIWERKAFEIKVDANETWLDIENISKVPASILKRYNKTDKLILGQKIKIPARKIYIVKVGDSAIGIAKHYKMTFSELINLNRLHPPYKLIQGQELKVIKLPPMLIRENKLPKFFLFWPIKGKLVANFGAEKTGKFNDGIKIFTRLNSNVFASAAGIVVYAGNEIGNYGNMVIIKHEKEWLTTYGNLNKIIVKKGDAIKPKQIIGTIENANLYFSLRNNSTAINPKKYLRDK